MTHRDVIVEAGSPSAGRQRPPSGLIPLVIGALGVVYGDLGTSPLYSIREAFEGESHQLAVDRVNVLGAVSIIVWTLVVIIGVKYVLLVLRADNRGEGGILALTALVAPHSTSSTSPPVRTGWLLLLGLFGYAPLTRIVFTSPKAKGQVYVGPGTCGLAEGPVARFVAETMVSSASFWRASTMRAARRRSASSRSSRGSSIDLANAFSAEHRRDTEVEVAEPVLAAQPGADGKHLARVLHDGSHRGLARGGGGVVAGPDLEIGDDLGGAPASLLADRFDLGVVEQLTQRPAVDLGERGDRHHGFAVGAEHDPFDPIRGDAEPLADEVLPSGRVQQSGFADHPSVRQAGRRLAEGEHLVEGVGGHDEHGVGGSLDELGRHVGHDLGVGLEKVVTAHSRRAPLTGGDDAHARSLRSRRTGSYR